MKTSDFLKTQLRLLVAQFGRKAVMEALAGSTDSTPEQLQEEISRIETTRRSRLPKRDKSLDELVGALPQMTDRTKELVMKLGRLFESKLFLPNLRNAEEFLRRTGATSRKFKKRREVLGPILNALVLLPADELESLVAQHANTGGKSDYVILANQLMGKQS